MKKPVFCLLFKIYCLFFTVSCVYRPIEIPEETQTNQLDSNIKNSIKKTLDGFSPYLFFRSWMPITTIWINTNFRSFDYENFFETICPIENQELYIDGFTCNLSVNNQFAGFKIKKQGDTIIIIFEKFNVQLSYGSAMVSAVWEAQGTKTNFTLQGHEKICDTEGYCKYKIVDTSFFVSEGREFFSAKGTMGNGISGVYHFNYKNLYYGACKNKPVGTVYMTGFNYAEAFFYEDKDCDPCVPVEIDGQKAMFLFCMPEGWLLQDLFKNLVINKNP